jgi:quinol monooxygenase YgiN
MWAQLIEMRMRPGKESELAGMFDQLRAAEQPDSGLLRTIAMHDQKDPSRAFIFVVFESEEKARAREKDPRRQEMLASAQATMAEMFAGPPLFVDLTVIAEVTP